MENAPEDAVTATETTPQDAPEASAEAAVETVAEAPAEAAAEAPQETAPEAPKPAAKAPGSTAFEAHLAALLTQIYADYDFQQLEGCPPGSRVVDLVALPTELKGGAPAVPEAGSKRSAKDKWPPRVAFAERPRDYRLHVYFSRTSDPAWSVPGKDILAISADRGSGLLLLTAEQKGYFLPSNRVGDLCNLFTPVQGSPFKISGAKLRKAAIARFFSLAGFARELADAHRK